MLPLPALWLASAAVILLMGLWARANRRSGWRQRPAEHDRLEAYPVRLLETLPRGPSVPPPDNLNWSASLIALEAALRGAELARPVLPEPPQGVLVSASRRGSSLQS